MAVIEIRSHISSYEEVFRKVPASASDVLCWFGIEINLHDEHDRWCCHEPGRPALVMAAHRHRYFTTRFPLRSPR